MDACVAMIEKLNELKNVVIMDKEELIEFLKENLRVNVWCDYGGHGHPQVNVGIYLCDEKINESSDYLLAVH